MARYTREDRERIVGSRFSGESLESMSKRTGVSSVSLSKWIRQGTNFEQGKLNRLHVSLPEFAGEAIKLIKDGVIIELLAQTSPQYIRALLGW